jgi:hypothetical protein
MGQRSREEKAQNQQYLTPEEEKAVLKAAGKLACKTQV